MTIPYYWQIRATYGDFQVHEHVLSGRFRVLAANGREFNALNEKHACLIARTNEIAAKSKVPYEQLVHNVNRSVGHYCPTKNCQYQFGVKECPVREQEAGQSERQDESVDRELA